MDTLNEAAVHEKSDWGGDEVGTGEFRTGKSEIKSDKRHHLKDQQREFVAIE